MSIETRELAKLAELCQFQHFNIHNPGTANVQPTRACAAYICIQPLARADSGRDMAQT